ncbi:uncharacterized protein LOC107266878 isoform X2 [Cephus cinctus]|uniref:Uncharacterized protein LOC107266878 isoform X2 n=1 Tax=Cephus cinctus TaxID=211228 RepID=A0AAJ7RGD6_CEPCN|nr:uncharacterized protein LOC107266878 isoform X2 [Cephus cinctus]
MQLFWLSSVAKPFAGKWRLGYLEGKYNEACVKKWLLPWKSSNGTGYNQRRRETSPATAHLVPCGNHRRERQELCAVGAAGKCCHEMTQEEAAELRSCGGPRGRPGLFERLTTRSYHG